MKMIPKSLTEWSIPIITDLLIQGYYETEFFDFKEMLSHSKNEPEKTRLYKSCCAFANSAGGFLVFWIKAHKTLFPQAGLLGWYPAFTFSAESPECPRICCPSDRSK